MKVFATATAYIAEQLCDNIFINCYCMTETEDKIDECNEELHQDAVLNSFLNTIETDSKLFETFKINKTSTNVPNVVTHSRNFLKTANL